MDQILAMRAFVAAVKVGNLGQAANQLGITRTLAARHIKALEQSLKTHLMIRTTRSLTLTAAGEKYFLFSEELLAEIDEMDATMRADNTDIRGELPVLCPKWMADNVARAMAEFMRLHPGIKPKLMLESQTLTAYDFLGRGCEAAIVMRSIPDSRIKARKILELPYVLCASPAFLENESEIGSPKQLENIAGLVQTTYPQWVFKRDGKTEKILPKAAFFANSYVALRAAAIAGSGVTAIPKSIVADDLASGQLVEVMSDWSCESQSLFAAFAPEKTSPARAQALVRFLPEWFRNNPL